MASLSTHVLDTSRGRPAEGIVVYLREVNGRTLCTAKTDADGRIARAAEALPPGTYELVFHAGEYFRRSGFAIPDPPFLNEVVIRFGIGGDPHYHVPLLLSPFGYSTYRGS